MNKARILSLRRGRYETNDEPYHSRFIIISRFNKCLKEVEEAADIDIKVDGKSAPLLVFGKKLYLYLFSSVNYSDSLYIE